MPSPILLLRLEGPLQSWGTRSRWDPRDTQTEPTKSGVVGLLGCALGYGMGDRRLETELDAGLRFGVRVENPGRVMEDYQTVTDFLPTADGRYRHSRVKTTTSLAKIRADPNAVPATIISPRFYLEDAAFLVALEEHPGHAGLLHRCEQALRSPAWPLYLGRKACPPTRPILGRLASEYENIEAALRAEPWSWLGSAASFRSMDPPPARLEMFIEAPYDPSNPALLTRQDAVRLNPARQYGFRCAVREWVAWSAVAPRGGGTLNVPESSAA